MYSISDYKNNYSAQEHDNYVFAVISPFTGAFNIHLISASQAIPLP